MPAATFNRGLWSMPAVMEFDGNKQGMHSVSIQHGGSVKKMEQNTYESWGKTELHPGSEKVQEFRKTVYGYYTENRRDFPWRQGYDPYHILVSEFMLQQTQTGRAAEKFLQFTEAFPGIGCLAMSPVKDVLAQWKGLGYNRRALYLHRTAGIITNEYGGEVPSDPEILKTLPGIGEYTSKAVSTFAYNLPHVFVETNIRTVLLHHFFTGGQTVHDKDIIQAQELTMDAEHPRKWYEAMMDYGAHLKNTGVRLNSRSSHYVRQKPFQGSDRKMRGEILDVLLENKVVSSNYIVSKTGGDHDRIVRLLHDLAAEGFVKEEQGGYSIV